ncbi:helix-turn-helix domain-containing protein [Paraflavitalea pollutisoli]|uniref:helix-turn-helix domain-containing protein n=1 Tax=Paraflavitalea pollutisoli TaxID=3034143 RepID=UPI0023EB02FC|nr:helix-turn-helix domain-containing protein [Paraflavitalea sp. H1-2-19X]
MNIVNGEEKPVVKSPILIPYETDEFWATIRHVIKEEFEKVVSAATSAKPPTNQHLHETPGLTQKPLYKMAEVCKLFQVTKPTVYDWCKLGKLKPLKIRSRVFFLWQDIEALLSSSK